MKQLKEVPLDFSPKLIISKELQSQIMFLHNKIQNDEWCGTLFYTVVSGDIENPNDLVLKAEKLFLGDIGNGTYTEQTVDETLLDFYDAYPEAMTWKQGYIHTHHNMSTFFSGTDMDELHTNAKHHNYYLSLIVNHKSDFCAKIAIIGESSFNFKSLDKENSFRSPDKLLILMNCKIEFEQSEFDAKRYEAIREIKANKPTYASYGTYTTGLNSIVNTNFKRVNYPEYTKTPTYNKQANAWPELDFDEPVEVSNTLLTNRNSLEKFIVEWLSEGVINTDTSLSKLIKIRRGMKIENTEEYMEELEFQFHTLLEKRVDFAYDEDGQESQYIFQLIEEIKDMLNPFKNDYNIQLAIQTLNNIK